mmetsp:Transcript_2322/g.3966  ORF Transcript_2322/g.3966 Transcript_2322/m.3966 type:complete len:114 (-) Transcript_2322:1280-1621(-)
MFNQFEDNEKLRQVQTSLFTATAMTNHAMKVMPNGSNISSRSQVSKQFAAHPRSVMPQSRDVKMNAVASAGTMDFSKHIQNVERGSFNPSIPQSITQTLKEQFAVKSLNQMKD